MVKKISFLHNIQYLLQQIEINGNFVDIFFSSKCSLKNKIKVLNKHREGSIRSVNNEQKGA